MASDDHVPKDPVKRDDRAVGGFVFEAVASSMLVSPDK
jgi:hypothetical protein